LFADIEGHVPLLDVWLEDKPITALDRSFAEAGRDKSEEAGHPIGSPIVELTPLLSECVELRDGLIGAQSAEAEAACKLAGFFSEGLPGLLRLERLTVGKGEEVPETLQFGSEVVVRDAVLAEELLKAFEPNAIDDVYDFGFLHEVVDKLRCDFPLALTDSLLDSAHRSYRLLVPIARADALPDLWRPGDGRLGGLGCACDSRHANRRPFKRQWLGG
jgi:hypothetical protein